MDKRLQEMLDHYEITQTLKQYCHGCDRADEERMSGVYLDDSWDDHGSVKAPGKEFTKLIMHDILTTTSSLYHMLGQSQINVNGDEAGAETYFFAVSRSTGEDGVELCNQLGGRFVDKLQREDGRWRIKNRVVLRDWTISIPIEIEWTSANTLTPGQRSNADPSFAALGLVHGGRKPNGG